MKQFANPRVLAAVLALSLSLAAGASLAAPRGERHGTASKGGVPAAHAMIPFFHERGLARLHDELKLDEKQEALWKEARDFVRAQREAVRARLAKDRAEIGALLDQPGTDLRTVEKRVSELRAEGRELHDAARERWLAVYDSLGDGQKEKVRLFFKDGLERMERFADRAKDPERGHRRGQPRNPATPASAR
jgi:Spy/CpxP family protein refolding chaperone